MNPQLRRLSASVAALAILVIPANANYVRAESPGVRGLAHVKGVNLNMVATAAKLAGDVQKAEPAGEDLSELNPFMQCKAGDKLAEGSVIQTGKSSWASIVWDQDKIQTRVWANTMVRISPLARTVYMTTGQLAFRKDPKAQEYTIETKRLQARIRGTTVRVLSDKYEDRIIVLETDKTVEAKNKLNGSTIILTPGVELVVRGFLTSSVPQGAAPQAEATELRLDSEKGELIFQDNTSRTTAYAVDGKAVLEDPMIIGKGDLPPLAALDKIKATAAKLPRSDNYVGNLINMAVNNGKADKTIVKNLKISCVPTRTSYYVGPNVGADKSIALPSLAYTDFMPAGVIPNLTAMTKTFGKQALSAQRNLAAPTMLTPVMPANPPATQDPLEQAQLTGHFNGAVSQTALNFAQSNTARVGALTGQINAAASQTSLNVPIPVATPVMPLPVQTPIHPFVQSPMYAPRTDGQAIPFQANGGQLQPFNGQLAQQLLSGKGASISDRN